MVIKQDTDYGPVTIKLWKLSGIYAGMPRYTMAVTATHDWTGRTADVTNEVVPARSIKELKDRALRILRARVLAKPTTTERVRTYHTSAIGTWQKNHVTDKRTDGIFLEFLPEVTP